MNLEQKEYTKLVEKHSGKSNVFVNCLRAFLVGGIICVIAQIYNDILPFSEEVNKVHTTVFMVFLGALLTALNVYDNIGKFAGAGSIVPITGFANSIVSPAMEFRSEGRIMGVGAQMFVVAGPVLVYGISSTVLVGLIYFLLTR
ncbi:MAG TPA: stage V sporulation protein AC [Clostridiaceae bacterium]|nr:stage V sporulation protein AC [Clostridiaceae bacterium]HOA31357.1 stage V sporulation protein AC [Clostridia bacterium]